MEFLSVLLKILRNFQISIEIGKHELSNIDTDKIKRAVAISLGSEHAQQAASPLRPIFQASSPGNSIAFEPSIVNIADDSSFFPKLGTSLNDGFNKLKADFSTGYNKLAALNQTTPIFTENLLALTKHYLSRVGASPEAPFVNVHDHCRLTAALYDCLLRDEADKAQPFYWWPQVWMAFRSFAIM